MTRPDLITRAELRADPDLSRALVDEEMARQERGFLARRRPYRGNVAPLVRKRRSYYQGGAR